jgi:hypothetical protein
VYFVEPGFLGDHRTDDHPGGADINTAQAYVNNVVNAVIRGPQWARQALFINYDEWGGFFDHVTPPRVPDDRASDDLDDDWSQLGFRLPAMAISPYSRTGYVHHDGPYEHTSILKFIEYRWDLEPLTTRDANAKNIGECFDYMENRTYDTYLGWLENGRGFLDLGLELTYTDPDDPSFSASPEHWAPATAVRTPRIRPRPLDRRAQPAPDGFLAGRTTSTRSPTTWPRTSPPTPGSRGSSRCSTATSARCWHRRTRTGTTSTAPTAAGSAPTSCPRRKARPPASPGPRSGTGSTPPG